MGMIKKTKAMMILGVTITGVMMITALGSDEKECAEELASLASCIPYVSGEAKKPVPQCCEDTKKVKQSKPKCLCVLIKESSDPSIGLPINTTLAIQMPSVCNIDAKVSDCPSILNLPPNSPDAKIFKETHSDSATSSSSDSSNSTPVTTSSSSSTSSSKPDTGSASNSGQKSKPIDRIILSVMLMMIGSVAFLFL